MPKKLSPSIVEMVKWFLMTGNSVYILTDFNYATLTSSYIFQNTVVCKLPVLR